jgi:hypothetical protein
MTEITPKKAVLEGEVYHSAANGTIVWVDDEVIGFQCGCGNDEVLTVGIYKDSPRECECGARLYYTIEIVVKEA